MGVPNRDVDDGLALLYLLGCPDIELLGVTTTFGNSTIDIVNQATSTFFDDFNLLDLPLLKGAKSKEQRNSNAALFLTEMVSTYPGEITILATGSLSNLYQAYQLDSQFFKKINQVVLMGGIVEPLVINGKGLDELNFASDPVAAYTVLSSEAKVTTMTGNICLQAHFGKSELKKIRDESYFSTYTYLIDKLLPWFRYMEEQFNLEGFYNWDTTAAVYVSHPQLFHDNLCFIESEVDDLKKGLLKKSSIPDDGYSVNIPNEIIDVSLFNQVVFDAWRRVD